MKLFCPYVPGTRAGATGTAGTAMAVPTSQKVGPRGTSKTGEKKFRCMILYRESPRVQDLPSKFLKMLEEDPGPPLKMALRPHRSTEPASGPGYMSTN